MFFQYIMNSLLAVNKCSFKLLTIPGSSRVKLAPANAPHKDILFKLWQVHDLEGSVRQPADVSQRGQLCVTPERHTSRDVLL